MESSVSPEERAWQLRDVEAPVGLAQENGDIALLFESILRVDGKLDVASYLLLYQLPEGSELLMTFAR